MTTLSDLKDALKYVEELDEAGTPVPWYDEETVTSYGNLIWTEGVQSDPSDPTGQTAMQTQDVLVQRIVRMEDARLIAMLRNTLIASHILPLEHAIDTYPDPDGVYAAYVGAYEDAIKYWEKINAPAIALAALLLAYKDGS